MREIPREGDSCEEILVREIFCIFLYIFIIFHIFLVIIIRIRITGLTNPTRNLAYDKGLIFVLNCKFKFAAKNEEGSTVSS